MVIGVIVGVAAATGGGLGPTGGGVEPSGSGSADATKSHLSAVPSCCLNSQETPRIVP